MSKPQNSNSFTCVATGLARALVSDCAISQNFHPDDLKVEPPYQNFKAIWDTGATNCVISQRVVKACGLKPTGMIQTRGVHGVSESETYLVSIFLPSGVRISEHKVTKGDLGDDFDVLIGMDIIGYGDFAVTYHDKKTKFSYRFPSIANIDFVEEHNKKNKPKGSAPKRKQSRQPKKHGKKKKRKN